MELVQDVECKELKELWACVDLITSVCWQLAHDVPNDDKQAVVKSVLSQIDEIKAAFL